jgi:hypothetical protein
VSAVIYAAIVVMWAVVLVPMWLRRHDAATESRSVDRFSTAMRTLSRRTSGTPGRRYVVMPRRGEHGPSVHVSGAAVPKRPRRTAALARPARGRASIVTRRRRVLVGLLGLTVFTAMLALLGVLSWLLQLVVDVALVGFCAHLRAQARRTAAIATQRRRAVPAATRPPARPARTVPAPARPAASPAPAGLPQERPDEIVAATGTDGPVADPAVDDDTWEPVPVPRPTYTMKPPAPAYEADPTYSPPVYEPAARAGDDAPAPAADSDLDEILERRWAVND